MIYDQVSPDDPIRQGDLFKCIPLCVPNLRELPVVSGNEYITQTWSDICERGLQNELTAIVAIRPISAIVITQDCDAVRSPYVSLCEIRLFSDVYPNARTTTKPKAWQKIITQHARINLKWFYLPADSQIGFEDRMGADFRSVVRVPLEDLQQLSKNNRVGRLNQMATEHFRERLGEFFRRYAYDEWYPLSKDEFEAYSQGFGDPPQPFDWQR